MNRTRSSPRRRRRAIDRALSRADQRGAAIFVVVMVVTMLLGIGIFAARSATLGTAASGNVRQMTQTHYTAEYAMLLAVAKLTPSAGSSPQSYLNRAGDANFGDYAKCQAQTQVGMSRPTCYRMSYDEIQTELAAQGYSVFPPYGLGSPTMEGYFWIELTDVSGPAAAPPGMLMNAGNQSPQFYDVTATAVAQVRTVNTGGATLDTTAAGTQSLELSRSFLRVGPINLN